MELDFKNGDKVIRNDGRVGKVISIFEIFERFYSFDRNFNPICNVKIKWENLLENGQPFNGEDMYIGESIYEFTKNEKGGYESHTWNLYSIGNFVLGEKNNTRESLYLMTNSKSMAKARQRLRHSLDKENK